jgi:regulatory protein YycI of two-component signal transduction system YycFG
MNQAPEIATAIEPRFEFTAYDDGASDINLFCVRNNSVISRLLVFNASDGVGGGYAEYIRDIQQTAAFSRLVSAGTNVASAFAETLSPGFIQPKISQQQAKGIAEELIANLGLADYVCTGERLMPLNNPHIEINDEDGAGLYEFMFTRSVNGVSITYTNDDMTSTPDNAESVAKPARYEKIRVFIDDEGVFAFRWNGPCFVEEIVSEETTLLSFADIMNCFEKMIVVKNEGLVSWDGSPVKKEIDITKITLGLMRVVEKDNYETAVIVPVWDFFGAEARQDSTTVSGMDGYESLLTINAIDGSIIDRRTGY